MRDKSNKSNTFFKFVLKYCSLIREMADDESSCIQGHHCNGQGVHNCGLSTASEVNFFFTQPNKAFPVRKHLRKRCVSTASEVYLIFTTQLY